MIQNPGVSRIRFITRWYERALVVLFALGPLLGVLYLHLFQDPALKYHHHLAHEVFILGMVLLGGFIALVSWRCYLCSGEVLLRWLACAFVAFSLIYLLHGLLTRWAGENIWLFLLYGPASRLAMGGVLIVGLLQYGRRPDPADRRRSPGRWYRWLAAIVAVDLGVAALACSPWAGHPYTRLSLEGGALLITTGGIWLLHRRRIRSSLMGTYAIALAFFAQSSISFMLGRPWNHQWWLAHLIFTAGFLFLSYGVIRAFHTTWAFSTVYSQEEVVANLRLKTARAERTLEKLRLANRKLERLAATDPLTGAQNRRQFLRQTAQEWEKSKRHQFPLSLLAIDIDHFKRINDTYGHPAGDEVLKAVVAAIRKEIRQSDLVGRFGGEEFMVLLPQTSFGEACTIAERLRGALANLEVPTDSGTVRLTVSIGLGQFGPDGTRAESVIKAADARLYHAKSQGRNLVYAGRLYRVPAVARAEAVNS